MFSICLDNNEIILSLACDKSLEFLSKEQDKLKEKIETEVPNIKKNDMTIQFHEERIIDLEEKNGYD